MDDSSTLTEEAVRHLQALIRLDTSNPPGNELPAAEYVAAAFTAEDIEARVLTSASGRASAVARLPGTEPGNALLLLSHLDVVAAEDATHWRYPPFSGTVADGAVWGRGALDLKGKVVADMMALIALKRSGADLRRGVLLAAVADEERGGAHGIQWLLEHAPEWVDAPYALGEGAGFPTVLGKRRYYLCATAERGSVRVRLSLALPAGHGAVLRENAALALARAVDRACRMSWPAQRSRSLRAFLNTISRDQPFPANMLSRRLDSGLVRALAQRLGLLSAQQAYHFHGLTHPVVSPVSLTADREAAQAVLRIDLLPGVDAADAANRLIRAVEKQADGIQCEVEAGKPAREEPWDTPLARVITNVTGELDLGSGVAPFLTPTYSDAPFLTARGTVVYGFAPVTGVSAEEAGWLVHGRDERMPVEGLGFGIAVTTEVVRRFCQLEDG